MNNKLQITKNIYEMLDYPEIQKQLVERLQEIGFNMDDWYINTIHATPENHWIKIGDKDYDSYDYIYLINKHDPSDVFYLWLDIAWTEGMKDPILYILYLHAELTASPIDNFDGIIEDHFDSSYPSIEDTNAYTAKLMKKYSIRSVPKFKDVIKKLVTPDQYDAIMKQEHSEKRK
jgi:hypothetical protein